VLSFRVPNGKQFARGVDSGHDQTIKLTLQKLVSANPTFGIYRKQEVVRLIFP
jgi:hypothetical protein